MRAGEGVGSKVTCGPSRREAASPWPLAFPPDNGSRAGEKWAPQQGLPREQADRGQQEPSHGRGGKSKQRPERTGEAGSKHALPCRRRCRGASPPTERRPRHLPLCWEGLHLPGKLVPRGFVGETPGQPPALHEEWPSPRPASEWAGAQSCQQGRSPRSGGGCTSRSGRCPAGS